MTQQLIEAIELEMRIVKMDYYNHVEVSPKVTYGMLSKILDKAKELQGKEKWAVVKESYLFDSKEQAEDILQAHIQSEIYDYTIVKIIEP
jgi:hypothetical protein